MNRRAVLKGGLVLAATAHTVALAPERAGSATLARLTMADGHASPFAEKGDVIVFDEANTTPESGATFVTKAETSGMPYVGRIWRDDDGHWWLERFARGDLYGPVSGEMMNRAIQGRVTGVWKHIT